MGPTTLRVARAALASASAALALGIAGLLGDPGGPNRHVFIVQAVVVLAGAGLASLATTARRPARSASLHVLFACLGGLTTGTLDLMLSSFFRGPPLTASQWAATPLVFGAFLLLAVIFTFRGLLVGALVLYVVDRVLLARANA